MVYKILILLFLLPLNSHALIATEEQFIAKTIEARAIESNLSPVQMVSIAVCESSLKMTAKNVNRNKSTDYGVFQINEIHFQTMRKAGLSPFNYVDNINYALFLIQVDGLRHFSASRKCWSSPKTIAKVKLLLAQT